MHIYVTIIGCVIGSRHTSHLKPIIGDVQYEDVIHICTGLKYFSSSVMFCGGCQIHVKY